MKNYILIIISALIFGSCLINRQIKRIKGSYSLGNSHFAILNDSSIINGYVYIKDLQVPAEYGSVSIKETKSGGFIDSSGYFSIKIPSGEYSIIASSTGCTDMVTKKISLKKNEVRSITFYLGTTIMYER